MEDSSKHSNEWDTFEKAIYHDDKDSESVFDVDDIFANSYRSCTKHSFNLCKPGSRTSFGLEQPTNTSEDQEKDIDSFSYREFNYSSTMDERSITDMSDLFYEITLGKRPAFCVSNRDLNENSSHYLNDTSNDKTDIAYNSEEASTDKINSTLNGDSNSSCNYLKGLTSSEKKKNLKIRAFRFIIQVAKAKPNTLIDLSEFSDIFNCRKTDPDLYKKISKVMHSFIVTPELRKAWTCSKKAVDGIIQCAPSIFFNNRSVVLENILFKGPSKEIDQVGLVDHRGIRKRRSKEDGKMTKVKDLDGDFLHPSMRCPHFTTKKDKIYVNSRDDICRKYIMSSLLNFKIERMIITGKKSIEFNYLKNFGRQSLKELELYGHMHDKDDNLRFKEILFEYLVGRKPQRYIRNLHKKPDAYATKKEGNSEHIDLFEINSSMYEGCMRHLIQTEISFKNNVQIVLNSEEFINYLNCKTVLGIKKVIESSTPSDIPYSNYQNLIALGLFKDHFGL